MDKQTNLIIIGLLILVVGFGGGYLVSNQQSPTSGTHMMPGGSAMGERGKIEYLRAVGEEKKPGSWRDHKTAKERKRGFREWCAATMVKVGKTPLRAEKKTGRNEMCPCGSGKKYKWCHGG